MLRNNSVSVSCIDGQVWDAEKVLVELVDYAQANQSLTVDTFSEGPCLQTSGLEQLVGLAADCAGIPDNRVSITTSNLLNSARRFKENKFIKGWFAPIDHVRSHNDNYDKQIQYHFGHFVSRSNWLRLYLASHLNRFYADKTLQSFHWQANHDYHKNHLGLEMLLNKHGVEVAQMCLNFLQDCPIYFENVPTYPMHYNSGDIYSQYPRFFVEIVCEPFFSGNTFCVSEKTWRAIQTRTPFIVQGPRYFLKNLQRLGFKTFDAWWSEGYDEDPWDHKPVEIIKIIDMLASKSLDEIGQIYEQMKPILDHNYTVFQKLSLFNLNRTVYYNAE
jgi:hypothetical protein